MNWWYKFKNKKPRRSGVFVFGNEGCLSHRFFEVLVDLVEEARGRQPFLIVANEEREILRHEASFDRVDADLFERGRKLREIGIVVELGAMLQAACPGEDRRD